MPNLFLLLKFDCSIQKRLHIVRRSIQQKTGRTNFWFVNDEHIIPDGMVVVVNQIILVAHLQIFAPTEQRRQDKEMELLFILHLVHLRRLLHSRVPICPSSLVIRSLP